VSDNQMPVTTIKEINISKFNIGDRVKILDKTNWLDGGYKIANWEGKIVEVMENPIGYVLMKADKTGYNMMFHEKELELLRPRTDADPISAHDGTLGFIDALQQKTKGKSVDVRLDI
jgi:hypothetical protein